MTVTLKPLHQQIMVITGASSGIGLATARMAAERGARVVLVSRDDQDLAAASDEIQGKGGLASHYVADVADAGAMQGLARHVVADFGRIDTWVNNAGVSIYGPIEQVPVEDARRLFDTNYWGVVNGSLAALPHLRSGGGALINVGSVLSETGYPLQGHYTASKFAVKGFTDSLRLEVESDEAPVSITLIQPSAIDTPYPRHARSYLGNEPQHLPPVYAPEIVAEAILHSAEHPERDMLVGGAGKVYSTAEKLAPRLFDRMKRATAITGQQSDMPDREQDTLFEPRPGDGRVRGTYPGQVRETSAYTAARLNRGTTLLGLAVIGAGLFVVSRARA